jgi:hypothetical protein
MAARRLLIVMLILLGLSTLAAALVPPQSLKEGTGTTTTEATQPVPADTVPHGQCLSADITVGEGAVPVVPLPVGDQLSLKISSNQSDELEVPRLGLVEVVAPDLPAHFNILAESPGSYGIRFVNADMLAARVEVTPRPKAGGKEPRSRAPSELCLA